MIGAPFVSVVVPLHNELDNVALLVAAVSDVLRSRQSWELVLVDDGSTDDTALVVANLARREPRIQLVQLARRYGQSAAMQAGFDRARGEVVVTMDGDLQNDPRDIPRLLGELEKGYDLVVGYRRRRRDPLVSRKIPSWAANRIISWLTGIAIRDNGCSLKAYRRELLDRIRLYSDLHRFIPALAAGLAGARIGEIPVRHHARAHGRSKYGLSRVGSVLVDLLTVTMIRSFRDRPLLMFGGTAFAAVSFALVFGVTAALALGFSPQKANAFVLPGSALLWLGLGCYLLMLGLIAEVAVHGARCESEDVLPLVREVSQ